MTTAQQLYALNLDQASALIGAVGQQRTVLVQGEMGTGKTTLLKTLSKQLPKHVPCYFDATTKDVGDITIPNVMRLDDSDEFVRYVPNEEFGVHTGKPVILMIDEFGKANPAVKNALLRVILEREVGCHKLHPDSIVFATTNLGAEGVGDLLPAHARNRVTVVTTRKPSNIEWIEWGINNGVDHTLLGWCKDNPQLFHSFVDIQDPDENPYIFHPKSQRAAFVSPRSLEAASDTLKVRDVMDDQTLTAALMGTIGDRGAMDLMAFVKLADQLPSLDSIKSDPHGAKVPDSASAVCMVVYRALATIESDWIDAWMDYMVRLDKEAQGLFVNGARAKNYSKQGVIMTNKKFTQWAMDNNYMFAADKV
jgi:hypothetical protein